MTTIEWTDETWNPVTGCSKVSEGCRNCYAETLDRRFNPEHKPWTGPNAESNVRLHPDKLDKPLHWRNPRTVFVNSMSDLFHEQVPFEFIAAVFGVMASCSTHTFQILTKRPYRMANWFTWLDAKAENISVVFPDDDLNWRRRHILRATAIHHLGTGPMADIADPPVWPLPNVWLGVSVENQQAADQRIPLLFQTPAAVRFLSCEPLLEKVVLTFNAQVEHPNNEGYGIEAIEGVDWVIAGAESGPNARPMNEDWVRHLRDQCEEYGVAFFYKQNATRGKKIPTPELDGEKWTQYPKAVTV